MTEFPGVECTPFDRFFMRWRGGECRVRLVSFDPRRNTFAVQLYGANAQELDGYVLHGVDREDIRFHFDCPRNHPDW